MIYLHSYGITSRAYHILTSSTSMESLIVFQRLNAKIVWEKEWDGFVSVEVLTKPLFGFLVGEDGRRKKVSDLLIFFGKFIFSEEFNSFLFVDDGKFSKVADLAGIWDGFDIESTVVLSCDDLGIGFLLKQLIKNNALSFTIWNTFFCTSSLWTIYQKQWKLCYNNDTYASSLGLAFWYSWRCCIIQGFSWSMKFITFAA